MAAAVDNHSSPADSCRKTPDHPAPPRPGRSRSTDARDSCPEPSPPGERVTPAPTKKPEAAKTDAPAAEGTTAGDAKKDAPGFTVVFVIAGVLAVAYAMMRRRE